MSFINEIRDIQAETIVKHEEEMRRDSDIVLKVVHIIKDGIKAKVSNYLWAKDTTSEEVKFVITDMLNMDKYKFSYTVDKKVEDIELTQPEYRSVVEIFLKEGFKVSQRDSHEEYYRDGQCPGFSHSVRPVRKLILEW